LHGVYLFACDAQLLYADDLRFDSLPLIMRMAIEKVTDGIKIPFGSRFLSIQVGGFKTLGLNNLNPLGNSAQQGIRNGFGVMGDFFHGQTITP
jgi:hypothetical protein